MSTTDIPVDNGVNVEALLGVREALADNPDIAAVPVARDHLVGPGHPQPVQRRVVLRLRRGAAAQDDLHLDADHPSSSPPRTTA